MIPLPNGRGRGGRAWLSVLAVLALSGCGGDAPVVLSEHPIPDSIDFDVAGGQIVPVAAPSGELASLAARLTDHRVLVGIGVTGAGADDPPDAAVFGRIVDVAVIGETRVAVLDQMADRVELFDLDGKSLGGFGGSGEGPGEFDVPIALLVPDSTEIQVLDGVGRVHRFTDRGDGEWAFEERRDLVGFPRDACVQPGTRRTILHVPAVAPGDESLVARGVLRLQDPDGSFLRSFGTPYRYDQSLVANRMRRGQVVCTGGGHAVLAFEGSSMVAAWRLSDGAELWNAVIDGVEVPKLREVRLDDGRPAVGQDPRGMPRYHGLATAVPIGEDRVLVQYARFAWEDELAGPTSEALESWIIEASTGEGGYIGDELPRIGAIRGSVVVFVHPEPYPRIEVARW